MSNNRQNHDVKISIVYDDKYLRLMGSDIVLTFPMQDASHQPDAVQNRSEIDSDSISNFIRVVLRIEEGYHHVLMEKEEPKIDNMRADELIALRKEGQLTIYWIENGKIANRSFREATVPSIINQLPVIGEQSTNSELIKNIMLQYGCAPLKERKTFYISHKYFAGDPLPELLNIVNRDPFFFRIFHLSEAEGNAFKTVIKEYDSCRKMLIEGFTQTENVVESIEISQVKYYKAFLKARKDSKEDSNQNSIYTYENYEKIAPLKFEYQHLLNELQIMDVLNEKISNIENQDLKQIFSQYWNKLKSMLDTLYSVKQEETDEFLQEIAVFKNLKKILKK
ncbi:MAG: hypothetical protein KIT56_02730 [Gammaproteobacteria bacterium]|nr:hypothetical protein [Gammaproteobacteria bacterium]